jgi:glycerol uptake facilitator-like aquaporin
VVTIARALSDTFAGIRPDDVAFFIIAQCLGAAVGVAAAALLWPMPVVRDVRPAASQAPPA